MKFTENAIYIFAKFKTSLYFSEIPRNKQIILQDE